MKSVLRRISHMLSVDEQRRVGWIFLKSTYVLVLYDGEEELDHEVKKQPCTIYFGLHMKHAGGVY